MCGNTKIEKLLIDAGADINKINKDGKTPPSLPRHLMAIPTLKIYSLTQEHS